MAKMLIFYLLCKFETFGVEIEKILKEMWTNS